jgi:hypothetical protein
MKIAHTTAEAVIRITNGLSGDFADFAIAAPTVAPEKILSLIRDAGVRHIRLGARRGSVSRTALCFFGRPCCYRPLGCLGRWFVRRAVLKRQSCGAVAEALGVDEKTVRKARPHLKQ